MGLLVRGPTAQAQDRLAMVRQLGRKKWRAAVGVVAVLAVAAWVIAASVGCGEPPPVDTSLLTGEPCEPPCWQGLIPGQSTGDEVTNFLSTSRLVDQSTVWEERSGCGLITRWRSPISHRKGRPLSWDLSSWVCVSDGILRDMEILLDCDLTLQQLLEGYGPPEKIDGVRGGIPERPYVAVALYYPDRGMMVQLELPVNVVQLEARTKVVRVRYFAVTTIEEMARALGVPDPGQFARELQDWQGYGPIDLH